MRTHPITKLMAIAIAGLATVTDAAAGGGHLTRGCAARDMQILMLIEQIENSNGVSAQKVNDAVFTMMHARMVCFEGNVADALALYDDINRSLVSDRSSSGQVRNTVGRRSSTEIP